MGQQNTGHFISHLAMILAVQTGRHKQHCGPWNNIQQIIAMTGEKSLTLAGFWFETENTFSCATKAWNIHLQPTSSYKGMDNTLCIV